MEWLWQPTLEVVVPLEMRKIKYDIAKLDIKVCYLQYKGNTLFSYRTSLVNLHRALSAHFFIKSCNHDTINREKADVGQAETYLHLIPCP